MMRALIIAISALAWLSVPAAAQLNSASSYTVTPLGAVGNGSTDDTAAIQAAINSLPATGGTVFFPGTATNVYCISSGLTIGNGSTAAVSTTGNVMLVGSGAGAGTLPASYGSYTSTGPTIKWCGSAPGSETYMMQVNGPLSGWGAKNLRFDANNVANVSGWKGISVMWGGLEGVALDNCMNCLFITTLPSLVAGHTIADSMHDTFANLEITTSTAAGGTALELNGSAVATTHNNVFDNTLIQDTGTGTHNLYFGAAEATTFDVVHIVPGSGATGVTYDYSIAGVWPDSIALNELDNSAATQWSIVGTPSGNYKPNYVNNLVLTNGGTYPINVANVYPDHATGIWTPILEGDGTAGAPTYSVRSGSYTITGQQVTAWFNVAITAVGGMAGNLDIGGLPVPSVQLTSVDQPYCMIYPTSGVTFTSGYTYLSGNFSNVSPGVIQINQAGSNVTVAQLPVSSIVSAAGFQGFCEYRWASK